MGLSIKTTGCNIYIISAYPFYNQIKNTEVIRPLYFLWSRWCKWHPENPSLRCRIFRRWNLCKRAPQNNNNVSFGGAIRRNRRFPFLQNKKQITGVICLWSGWCKWHPENPSLRYRIFRRWNLCKRAPQNNNNISFGGAIRRNRRFPFLQNKKQITGVICPLGFDSHFFHIKIQRSADLCILWHC